MPDRHFASADECAAALAGELNIDPADPLLGSFVATCEGPAAAPPKGSLSIKLGRWVVRDDDVKLFEAVKAAWLAFATAHLTVQDLTLSGGSSIAFGVFQVFRDLRRSGVVLTHRQAEMVSTLKTAGEPLSPANLLVRLRPGGWTEADVAQTVKELKAAPARKGSVKVVEELGDGRITLGV